MKNIKLLSALALSIFAISAVNVTATADTKTSDAFVSFREDTSPTDPKLPGESGAGKIDPQSPGDLLDPSKGPTIYTPVGKNELGIVQRPSVFNFGETILQPDSKRNDLTVNALPKNVDGTDFADKYSDGSYIQYVTVYDGRTASDGWELNASAATLTDVTDVSKKLTGATISVSNTTRWNEDADAGKGSNTNLTGSDFTIKTDGTPTRVMATTTAKYESDVIFKSSDVALTIPKAVIQTGNFESTVTWTLVAAATP
ncbi:cell surface protein [Bacilli bacterium]|nr:cell surface protein [Bacilli bacterium]